MIAYSAIRPGLNNKHRSTLEAVFSKPTPSALEWSRIEALLVAAGCVVIEGRGSRVLFATELM